MSHEETLECVSAAIVLLAKPTVADIESALARATAEQPGRTSPQGLVILQAALECRRKLEG